VQKQLETNNFFNAGHSINLSNEEGSEKTEYTTSESLLEKIEEEKQRVLSDTELRQGYDICSNLFCVLGSRKECR
jgi:hypothetical protein